MREGCASRLKYHVSNGYGLRNGLIAGSVLLTVVLTFAIGFGFYTGWGHSRGALVSLPAPTEAPAELPLPPVEDGGYSGGPDLYPYYHVPAAQPGLLPTTPDRGLVPQEVENRGFRQPGERLIIRNGGLSMVVEDTRAAQQSIEEMVAEMASEGAYVVTSDEQGGIEGSSPRITMKIRVPATRFDEAMDRLAGLAVEVTARSESGQDVTEEYIDLEARLESLEAARQRLLEIKRQEQPTNSSRPSSN